METTVLRPSDSWGPEDVCSMLNVSLDLSNLPYRCPKCGSRSHFRSLRQLKDHLETQHPYLTPKTPPRSHTHDQERFRVRNNGSPLSESFRDEREDLEKRLQEAKENELRNRLQRHLSPSSSGEDSPQPSTSYGKSARKKLSTSFRLGHETLPTGSRSDTRMAGIGAEYPAAQSRSDSAVASHPCHTPQHTDCPYRQRLGAAPNGHHHVTEHVSSNRGVDDLFNYTQPKVDYRSMEPSTVCPVHAQPGQGSVPTDCYACLSIRSGAADRAHHHPVQRLGHSHQTCTCPHTHTANLLHTCHAAKPSDSCVACKQSHLPQCPSYEQVQANHPQTCAHPPQTPCNCRHGNTQSASPPQQPLYHDYLISISSTLPTATGDVAGTSSKHQHAVEALDKARERISNLKRSAEEFTAEQEAAIERLRTELMEKDAKMSRAQLELTTLTLDQRVMQRQLDDCQRRQDNSAEETLQLRQSVEEKEALVQDKQREISQLQECLDTARHKEQSAKSQLAGFIADLQTRAETAEAQLRALTRRIQQHDVSIDTSLNRSLADNFVSPQPFTMPVLQQVRETVPCRDPPTNTVVAVSDPPTNTVVPVSEPNTHTVVPVSDPPTDTVTPVNEQLSQCPPSSGSPRDQAPPGGDIQIQEVDDTGELESDVENLKEEPDTVVEYTELSSDENNDTSEPDCRSANVRSLSEELAEAMSADLPPATPTSDENEDKEFMEVFQINENMVGMTGEEPEMMDISLSSGQYENEETASVVSSNLPTEDNETPSGELPVMSLHEHESMEHGEDPSVTGDGDADETDAIPNVPAGADVDPLVEETDNQCYPGETVGGADHSAVELREDKVSSSHEAEKNMTSHYELKGKSETTEDSTTCGSSGKDTEVVASWKTFSDLCSANPNNAEVQRPTNDEILEKKATLQLKSLPSNQLPSVNPVPRSVSAAIFSQSSVQIVYNKKPGRLDVIREESDSCAEESVDGSPVLRSKLKSVQKVVVSSSIKPAHSGPSCISSPASSSTGLAKSVTSGPQAPPKPLRPSVLGIRTQYNVPRKLSPMTRSSRSPQVKGPTLSPLSEGKACSPSGRGRFPVLGKRSAWRRLSLPASLSPKEGVFPRPLSHPSPSDKSLSGSTRSLPAILSHSDKYKARSPLTPEADYNFARRYVPRASAKLKSPSGEPAGPKVTEFLKRRKLREYSSHHPHYYHHSPAYSYSGHIHTLTVTRGKAAENQELKLTPVRVDTSPLDVQPSSLALNRAFPERWVKPGGGEMLVRAGMTRSVSFSEQAIMEARSQSEPGSTVNSPDSLDSDPPVTTSSPTAQPAVSLPSPSSRLQYYFMPEGTDKKTFVSAEEMCLSPGEIRRGSILFVPEDPDSQSSLSWDTYSELSAFDLASSPGSVTSASSGPLLPHSSSSSLVVTFSTSAMTSSVATVSLSDELGGDSNLPRELTVLQDALPPLVSLGRSSETGTQATSDSGIAMQENTVYQYLDLSSPLVTSTPVKPPRTFISPPVSVDVSDESEAGHTTETRPGVDEIHHSKTSVIRSEIRKADLKNSSKTQNSESSLDGIYRRYQERSSLERLQAAESFLQRTSPPRVPLSKMETSSFTRTPVTKPSSSSLGSQASKNTISPQSLSGQSGVSAKASSSASSTYVSYQDPLSLEELRDAEMMGLLQKATSFNGPRPSMSLGSIGNKLLSPGSATNNHGSGGTDIGQRLDTSTSDRLISTVAQVHNECQPHSSAAMKCVYSNYEVRRSKSTDAQTSMADMATSESGQNAGGRREPRPSTVLPSQISSSQQEQLLQQQQRHLRQQLRSVAQQRQQLRASQSSMTDTDDITSITDLESSVTSGLSEITSRLDEVNQRLAGTRGERKQSLFSTIGTQSSNIFSLSSTESQMRRLRRSRRRQDALFCVFMYLDTKTLCRVGRVSRDWHAVSRHPALWRKVDLKHARIKPFFLRAMANWCTELQSLSLEGIRAWKRRKDEKAARYLRSVRGHLESGLEALLSSVQDTLISLRVVDCGNVLTDRCLWLASCHCRRLERVAYISETEPVGSEVIWALGAGCRRITTLIVPPMYPCQSPSKFSNRCVQMVARCWPQLRVLCIGGVDVDQKGLTAIARYCQKVQVLELDHMFEINEILATTMSDIGLKALQVLDFTFTPVTPKAVLRFLNTCSQLTSLSIHVGISDYYQDPNSHENRKQFRDITHKLHALKHRAGFAGILTVKTDYG